MTPQEKPQETKTMGDEYETLVAHNLENCKKILEWIFSGEVSMRNISDGSFTPPGSTHLFINATYRRKKPTPPPNKVKKLVDRTPEELSNFIGVAFFRNVKRIDIFRLFIDNVFANQECYEVSLDRGKTWQPMQKTVEVDA